MHPHAFYISLVVFLFLNQVFCEVKLKWYSELQSILTNCPSETWRSSGQEEFFETFRSCIQDRALVLLDSLLTDDVIPVFDGLELIRFQEDKVNVTENYTAGESGESNWSSLLLNRLLRVLRSHVFKVDVDRLTNRFEDFPNDSQVNPENQVFQGRRRRHRRRHNHMMPLMMMGLLLMGSILIPMGFQFLAVLGGKALLLAKMALILSSIQGLKRIATNGVNYGLYHAPVAEGWHERSSPEIHDDPNLNYKTFIGNRP